MWVIYVMQLTQTTEVIGAVEIKRMERMFLQAVMTVRLKYKGNCENNKRTGRENCSVK